jgi:hypothetical protein
MPAPSSFSAMRACTSRSRRTAVKSPSPPPPEARNSARYAAESCAVSPFSTSVTTKARVRAA